MNVAEIVEQLEAAADAYYNSDDTIMSDAAFDALEAELRQLDPTNTYFLSVGAEVRGEKVPLPVKLGSLDQVYDGDTEKWIITNELGEETIIITDKLDGMSILIAYDSQGDLKIAFTRGDGHNGHDITRHVRRMKTVPQNATPNLMIRGEIIMRDDDFDRLNAAGELGRVYKNPRNYTTGQINKKEATQVFLDHAHVIAYEIVG